MAMLCICGVCIPYTVLWPFVLLILKQIWGFISPSSKTTEKKTVEEAESKGSCCQKNTTNILSESNEAKTPLDYKNDMDWDDVVNNKKTTIFRFTAKWCKPCKSLDPVFESLSKESSNSALFYNVDVDECDEVAALNGALTIPLFVSYRAGKRLDKFSGSDEAKVRQFVTDSIEKY